MPQPLPPFLQPSFSPPSPSPLPFFLSSSSLVSLRHTLSYSQLPTILNPPHSSSPLLTPPNSSFLLSPSHLMSLILPPSSLFLTPPLFSYLSPLPLLLSPLFFLSPYSLTSLSLCLPSPPPLWLVSLLL